MIKQILICLLITFMIESCSINRPDNSPEDSIQIKIECRNTLNLKRIILERFRAAKARDIDVDSHDDDFIFIQAGFLMRDTPQYKVEELAQDIQDLAGVLNVDLEKNKTVIKQVF